MLSALVELKWIVLCGRWFWTYTFLYALLVLSLINFNIGVANLWAW